MTTDPDRKAGAEDVVSDEELVADDDTIIGRALSWSIGVVVVIGLAVFATTWALSGNDDAPPPTETHIDAPQATEELAAPPDVSFTDVTTDAGLDFVHVSGALGDKLMPETMGSGAAFLDYDGDGDQDILLVNATYWPGETPDGTNPPTMGLFQNDGSGRFKDVTDNVGLSVSFYGTGVAVGDYDNDGDVDLFVSALGADHLFENIDGRFRDVTAAAGVAGGSDGWSTSSSFLDYDNDGDLDLFVCRYIRWSKEIDFRVDFRLTGVGRAYGPPMNFEGTFSRLYRNEGDGTFTDVSAESGVRVQNPVTGSPMGKALGVAPIDIDDDGFMDLLVANDTVQNFFFHNQGDGTFEENGAVYGVAFDRQGSATGAMGIDSGNYRNDESIGFFIGNFANEMTSVYVSQGDPTLFADEAISEGIGSQSRLMLSFGVFLFDYDLDGRLDLFQANGHLEEEINTVQSSQHYEQPPQLFWNCGPDYRRCFVPVRPSDTGDLSRPLVGRGAAYGDYDGDGDLDILLTQTGRRAVLMRNDQQTGHHWIRLKLIGTTSNRDAIGAVVETQVGQQRIIRRVMPTRSYQSQVELPITIGLGDATSVESVQIRWPGGDVETVTNLRVDETNVIQQGRGVVE
jgi:enediyne biosynthesis protein E4